ncbi:MAG: S8 family peptidase [Candidatus Hodarchaeales archaeon]
MKRKIIGIAVIVAFLSVTIPMTIITAKPDVEFHATVGPPSWLFPPDDTTTYWWEDDDPETPWGIERTYEGNFDGDQYTGEVIVAVVDTGIDLDHPDLAPHILWSIDFTGSRTGADDDNGHGTHCAGIIGAIRDNNGVVGMAPNVYFYAVKVLDRRGSGTWEDVMNGIYAAVDGPDGVVGTDDDADVISMSLGASSDPGPEFYDAIKYAYNNGVVLVAAAGNEGDGSGATDEYSYPAAYPEVIAVGATDKDDSIASFSNSGPFLEVAAPGVDIYSTYEDGSYATLSGTSMACPHVSGLVALIIMKYGKLPIGTFDDTGTSTVRGILHNGVLDLGDAGWDSVFGYGLILVHSTV